MALFNKEPDRNTKSEQVTKPQTQTAQPTVLSPASAVAEKLAPKPGSSPATEGRAYLDSGTKVSGKLSFEGPARIDGHVDGEINAKDSLIIGESAVVTAQVKAAKITIAGKVSGDVTASQRIEIRPAAKVVGNLTAPVLVVHEGALFEGHCAMQPESAREERKLTVFPKEERLAQAGGQKQA
jgi:cytoskeletal protein CcmA (bactofilin family)